MYAKITSYIQNTTQTATNYLHLALGEGEVRNKRLKYITFGSLSVVSISYLIHYLRVQSRKKENELLTPYFSVTYTEARDKFKEAASKIDVAKQHSIIIDTDSELSIDLCYIPGDQKSKHVILHFSATHGVEGYAGSAIQINLLKNEITKLVHDNTVIRPHILFIHSLNPFGMANNRRFNKSNIDLNRNCILNKKTANTWNQVRQRDPKKTGYADLDHVINPPRKPTWFRDDIWFYYDAIKCILIHGMKKLKKVVVEGQYHKKDGLYFGGTDISIEHDLLSQFLVNGIVDKFDINLCDIAQQLTILDVHTGLGNYGIDYLLVDNADKLYPLFPTYKKQQRILDFGFQSFWQNMYKESTGWVTHKVGYCSLFKNSMDTILCAQEFGTYTPVSVFKALRNENMAYTYCNDPNENDIQTLYRRGIDVKNIFYPAKDPWWKNNVIQSGTHVFNKCLWR